MMRHYKYLILLLLLPSVLCAQSLRQQVAKKEVKTEKEQQTIRNTVVKLNKSKFEPDTVYCLSTNKQHGWFLPMDVLSLENARKHGGYIMFSRKNSLGHWTKLETFDAYGNRKSLGFRPYILSDEDPRGDQNWINKVKTGCILEMIADPMGENVIQERVYDKNMNLVYSFSHTPIGNRKYIGSYKDLYGLPAEMRNDSAFTYGTLVVITEDKWGNDSTIEYVDAKGVPKENSNGVGVQFYVHDKSGRVIRQGSANHNGEFVIDNWGNCGTESVYDKKSGKLIASINMDNYWKPKPLPNLRKEAGWSAGTTKRLYKYDNYGRLTEQKFVTIENEPDTNIYGTHKIIYTRDDFGNITSYTGYDIAGKLVPYEESGEAREIIEYDAKGREKYYEFYDKNNQLISTEGYLSRIRNIYGDDDNLDEQVYWRIQNGIEDTCYYYKRADKKHYQRLSDGSYEIDSLDEKGRNILTAYYNADGTPMFNKEEGFHRKSTIYLDNGTHTFYSQKYFDTRMDVCGQYPTSSFLVDSIIHTEKKWFYDIAGNLRQTFIFKWNNDFNWPLAEYDMNAFGIICRAGGTSYVRHYIAEVSSTQKQQFSTFVGRDEFNEPDYICSPTALYYYQRVSKTGGNKFYDVENNVISDFEKLRNDCPKAMSIEVTDSSAYHLGLKDNDIILRYGDSYQINDTLKYWDFIGEWSVAQCIEAPREKKLLLFRINPKTKAYGIVSLTLPKGNPSQLGFIAHPTFKTKKQRTRIIESITDYCKQCSENGATCLWDTNIEPSDKNKTIVVAFPDMYRDSRYEPYPLKVTDPSIILAYNVPSISKFWSFGENADSLKSITSYRNDCQIVHPFNMFCLKKSNCFEKHDFTDKLIGFTYFNNKVSKSQYDYFEKQYKIAEKQIKKDIRSIQKYHQDQLFGIWQTEVPDKNAIIKMHLLKDGTIDYESIVSNNGELQDDITCSLVYNLSARQGKWFLQGQTIMLNISDVRNDCTISKICIDGLVGEEKETKINEIKTLFDQNKREFISNADFSKLLGTSEFIIQDVENKELKVTDGTTIITFKKIK